MDDILVYSHTLSDHQWIICQVLSTLQKQRLFLKPEKCKFEQKEVEYLRLVILKDHVAMDLTKVCRVMEWPTPMKVKEVQSFLGFVNFYWKFICNFSDITCPLYALTCKTQWWVWGSPEQEAFDALKKAITSAPILTFPSQSGCFCLECNASNFATRVVLSQAQAEGMPSQSPSCERDSLMCSATTRSVSKGVIQRKKESQSSVTSSPNDKQIDLALWLWQSKQG